MSGGFEGSYLGDAGKISDRATLECKICWTPYDPALGDETRMVPPGTPFVALPEDWRCPVCDGPKAQFMVVDDPRATGPGAPPPPAAAPAESGREVVLRRRLVSEPPKLVAEFREIWHAKMRELPIVNRSLHVEAVGFRVWGDRLVGTVVSPWFLNLFLLPGPDDDWSGLKVGSKELIEFPSGLYEFIFNTRPLIGPYRACSLFSPMDEFRSQLQATDCARAVMAALFDPANRADADRVAAPEGPGEADAMAVEPLRGAGEAAGGTSRRAVLTAGLSLEGRRP